MIKSSPIKQAFSGITVIAVARIVAAPFAAYQLAMLGANVITIEDPEGGDSHRRTGDLGTIFRDKELSRTFLSYNSNKRSMCLNISTPAGQSIFRRMAAKADVVIENLKGGTMAKYGIGYDDLRKVNKRLVFASVTGYGQTGPKNKDPAIDGVIQAVSGMMSITGTPESGPLKTGSTVVDFTTGYVAAFAIAAALHQRSITGEGQAVDVSMLETAMTLMSGETVRALTGGGTPPLVGNGSGKGGYVSNTYPCKEGYLAIAAGAPIRRKKLWHALGRDDIPLDPRFESDEAVRAHMTDLDHEITKTLSSRTAAEWEKILNDAGVAAMAVLPLDEAVHHPQLKARRFFFEFPADSQPGLPEFEVPTAAYRMSESPVAINRPPPLLGQHTDEVLREFGFSDAEILELKSSREVIG